MISRTLFFSGVLLMTLALVSLDSGPEAAQKGQQEKDSLVRTTGSGQFEISLSVTNRVLSIGPNSIDLVIRDRQNRKVTGAEITVTPWLPAGGHGVWEKPVITDRGGGNYHADNVVIARNGQWDLRILVKKGGDSGGAVFSIPVGPGGKTGKEEVKKPAAKYPRTLEYYKVPNVTLINQDGKPVRLRSYLDSGKPVIIDFIYTTCTTICPILSAGFSNLRDELGDASATVQLVSISVDPEHDRPEQMKRYLDRYNSGEGWDFLTGSREDIALVLRAFDASVVDKMSHLPLYILRGPKGDEWVRIRGLIGQADLLRELRGIENK
ncbi:MAG: SCO family protein [Thermodesulfovibrionales bacterium]